MARRRLTPRQTERIAERQRRRLQGETASADTSELGPEQPGTVVARFGATLHVEDAQRNVVLCTARQNVGDLVCGDRALWRAGAERGVVVALFPRTTLLSRLDTLGHTRLIAANVDSMFVVLAPLPAVSAALLDGYLVAATLANITPVIVVNKCDLLDADARAAWERDLDVYRRIGYAVHFVSTTRGDGLDELLPRFAAHTSVVVGHSGVGKSSLLKRLLPGVDIAIGDVSVAGLGKHTTTVTRLYHLAPSGAVIDSPGVRDFTPGRFAPADAARGFVEFAPHLGQCKFGDCRHTVEPGCAILAAVRRGEIDARRVASYRRLLKED